MSTRSASHRTSPLAARASQNSGRIVGGSAGSSRPKAFTEKQIAARRDKEQANLERWQKYNKYWSEVRARLELFEHWDQKEQLRRTKSTGSHLNRLGTLDCAFTALGSLDQLNSPLNRPNRLSSFNHSLSCLTEELHWSSRAADGLASTSKNHQPQPNQQLANELTANRLASELINELYIVDPRRYPYDIDVELLRKPEAVEKLRRKVRKQESELGRLRDACLTARRRLKLRQRSRASLAAHRKQLEQLYLEYSNSWLADWQQRLARLALRCSDEELNLLFPARRGQIKGKDRLRLRNNLVSEHLNRCRQLLLQVRKLSGYYKVRNVTGHDAERKPRRPRKDKCGNVQADGRALHFNLDTGDEGDQKGEPKNKRQEEQTEEQNFAGNNEMQSHLMQLLTDDERQVLSSVLATTIAMLDTFTTTIRRRASLYAALFE